VEARPPVDQLRRGELPAHVRGVLVVEQDVQPEPARLGLVKRVMDWFKWSRTCQRGRGLVTG
jgi:hypothetical protein